MTISGTDSQVSSGTPKKNPFVSISSMMNDNGHSDLSDDKKKKFEMFVTYRKRLTRLAFVQALWNLESNRLSATDKKLLKKNEEADIICNGTIFIYKTFFYAGKYGVTRKTKKLEERFLKGCIFGYMDAETEVDDYIKKFLKDRWTITRLDSVIRAILRCGVYEILYSIDTESKVLVSEYTGLVGTFFEGEAEVGFINAMLDKVQKLVRKDNK